jgi:hypothetical protein
VKPQRISNQPTYKPRSYKFSSHSHILHKVHNNSGIHQSLGHKVTTTQVHIEIAEANSFKATHTFSLDTVLGGSHFQKKASDKKYGTTIALGPSCRTSPGTSS